MSKKFKAGCDEVFDGTDRYIVTYNSSDEMGEDGVYITLSNSGDNIGLIKQYVNKIRESGNMEPHINREIGSRDVNLTSPHFLTVGEQNDIGLYAPYMDLNIIDSAEVELPDKVFDLFNHFITSKKITINDFAVANTDGILQSFVKIDSALIAVINTCKTRRVTTFGCQDKEFILNKSESYKITACTERTFIVNVFSSLTGKFLSNLSKSTNNYPHKPVLEKIYKRGFIYLRVTTNVPAHGNIYFNGGAEPTYTYTTSRVAPYTAEIEINQAGAYTANIISETIIEGQHYYAYGELSDTLIIEKENFNATLSFNEYTGILSCITDKPDAVYNYQLNKLVDGQWKRLEHSGDNQFQITESGTYKIDILTGSNLAEFNVSPSSITVKSTLDTPTAYSDPAFPSQLGFDEVENANMYDIYRVNDDGDDELVATISPNNIISRIMRKEKMFIVIPNDEVRNV